MEKTKECNGLEVVRARLDKLKSSYLQHVRIHGAITFGVNETLQIAYDLLDTLAEAGKVVEATREKCCKVMCSGCLGGEQLEYTMAGWSHISLPPHGREYACGAAKIRDMDKDCKC